MYAGCHKSEREKCKLSNNSKMEIMFSVSQMLKGNNVCRVSQKEEGNYA